MRIILFVTFLTVFTVFPVLAQDKPDSAFSLDVETLRDMCLKNEALCKLWIQGVVEGVEFAHLISAPSASNEPGLVFCYPDDDMAGAVDNIQKRFMSNVAQGDYEDITNSPAVFVLANGMKDYLCRP